VEELILFWDPNSLGPVVCELVLSNSFHANCDICNLENVFSVR